MSVAQSVAEVLRKHVVVLEVESIDRTYLNVYVPQLQAVEGTLKFIRIHRGHKVASTRMVEPITRQFIGSIERFAKDNSIPLITFEKGQRKDDFAKQQRKTFQKTEGVVFIGKALFRAKLPQPQPSSAPTVAALVEHYRAERMPTRYNTRRGYESWLKCHVLPRWGAHVITDVQPRDVELWLISLPLAPKSKAEVRASLGRLWDFAMWSGNVPVQRNPMSLVTVKGASKRLRQPRSLTAKEFQQFVIQLREPFRTVAVVCVSLGLRISECLALMWSDVDWLNGSLLVQRGIVIGRVAETKTEGSRRSLTLAPEILAVLKTWKMSTQFGSPVDWVFASPSQLGRLPWSYPWTWKMFQDAAVAAKLETFGTHTLRHTYRSWLDAVGTTIAVQQKLMRHADIRTTMNVYGTVVTDEMSTASGKVARLVVNGTGDGTEPNSSH